MKNNTVCGKSFIQKKTETYTESVYLHAVLSRVALEVFASNTKKDS